jgi:hypothetical protein
MTFRSPTRQSAINNLFTVNSNQYVKDSIMSTTTKQNPNYNPKPKGKLRNSRSASLCTQKRLQQQPERNLNYSNISTKNSFVKILNATVLSDIFSLWAKAFLLWIPCSYFDT